MSFRDTFPEFFKEKKDLDKLWRKCVFVFDANVIINLYRYSDDTKDSLLNVLEAYKDRVWISHQAAKEYLRNRTSVIAEEETNFVSAASKVESFVNDFQNFVGEQRKHPFVKDALLEKLVSICDELKGELNENGKKYFSRINDDEIRRKIESIFSDKIGSGFSEEELKEIFEEGIGRYNCKIPPGYEDEEKGKKKGENKVDYEKLTFEEKNRVFGDLVIWKEVIKKASEEKVNIVFVTGDNKGDWWLIEKGKTMGPRIELIKEFESSTEMTFYMYSAYSFLDIAQKNLGLNKDEKAVSEIREVNERNIKPDDGWISLNSLGSIVSDFDKSENILIDKYKRVSSELDFINRKIIQANSDIDRIRVKMEEIPYGDELEGLNVSPYIKRQIELKNKYARNIANRENKLLELMARREMLEYRADKIYKNIL